MKDPPEIKALLLDADWVIQSIPPDWLSCIERLIDPDADKQSFLVEVFEAESQCITGQADFEIELSKVLNHWGSKVHVDDAARIWHKILPDPDILRYVRQLRSAGELVCLATNQHHYRYRFMTNELGYGQMFDTLFASCEMGIAKPSESYFIQICQQLDLSASNLLFIDDITRNVESAKSCGLFAERFHLVENRGAFEEILAKYNFNVE
ncbi:HAD family hydrolase [Acaryochloris marina]|uniref:HAD family hydrolase n=1 Tax=Acaryochloris marina TaxID=155978 RepID=UPI001BB01A13|nr:HAD-IA family hydrolase [Acaryochloris marina]QUY45773.1 HAD-IA family hydrolase [Acaryochloris marina S15]